ncbi:sugar phosphate isomerase/epimerase family protein [Pseudonocardia sp.]|jgi:sugar phosphate isomerase/epimerase|uniref:sugar phosphate isomerase/epimerase family protein n=1 Tax=Pseudonocardia sp. TaxID=60912 RepID=UPI003D0AD270
MSTPPKLVATSWTVLGDVTPRDPRWVSPIALPERLDILAAQGWHGVGFTQDELETVRDDGGFADLRGRLDAAGIGHVEVEFLSDWWCDGAEGDASRRTEEVLLDAAAELGAAFVKVGTAFREPIADLEPLVEPLARLGDRAAARGQRIVLEPAAVAMVESVPRGSELVSRTGRDNIGLLVDLWHVLRAGTTPEELVSSIPHGQVWAVELTDADHEPVGDLFTDTVDNRRYCGEGDIDIPSVVEALRTLGFDGPWGVEILSTEHRALPLADGLLRARDTATRFVS